VPSTSTRSMHCDIAVVTPCALNAGSVPSAVSSARPALAPRALVAQAAPGAADATIVQNIKCALESLQAVQNDATYAARALIVRASAWSLWALDRVQASDGATVGRSLAEALGVGKATLSRHTAGATKNVDQSPALPWHHWQRQERSDKLSLTVASDFWHSDQGSRQNPDMSATKRSGCQTCLQAAGRSTQGAFSWKQSQCCTRNLSQRRVQSVGW